MVFVNVSAFKYNTIKNYAWDEQRLKQHYIFLITLLGAKSAI